MKDFPVLINFNHLLNLKFVVTRAPRSPGAAPSVGIPRPGHVLPADRSGDRCGRGRDGRGAGV